MKTTVTTVGIKELKASLSHYVSLAAAGLSITVTDRGVPVAVLSPIPPAIQTIEAMQQAGLVRWSGKKFSPPQLRGNRKSKTQKNPDVSGAVIEDRER
jgi:prevent-host-death family protein